MPYGIQVDPTVIGPTTHANVFVTIPNEPVTQPVELVKRDTGEVVATGQVTLMETDPTVGLEGDTGTDYFVRVPAPFQAVQNAPRNFVVTKAA